MKKHSGKKLFSICQVTAVQIEKSVFVFIRLFALYRIKNRGFWLKYYKKAETQLSQYRRLKEFREDHDLTQKQVADMLYMHVTQYRRYETGEKCPFPLLF